MMRWIGLALVALVLPAHGQVYKCDVNGSTVFQGEPCDGSGESFTPSRDISVADMPGAEDSEAAQRRIQERMERQREENARYREYANNQGRIRKAEEEGRITRGMSKAQVREIWGGPWETLVNYDEAGNRCVVWYYGGPIRAERPEVTFCKGRVTTFRAYGS